MFPFLNRREKFRAVLEFLESLLDFEPFRIRARYQGYESSRIKPNTMDPDWSNMISDILELISDRLPLKDLIAFRGVCQQWRLAPSGRSNISKFSKGKPWLMFYGLAGDKCDVYSGSHPTHCTFYLPDLQGATIMESKFGWVIAHRGEHFFLYNCFTLEKINLPEHRLAADQACTFTALPTCSDCIVFIVSRKCDSELELSLCHIGDATWEVEKFDANVGLVGTMVAVHCCSCSRDCTGGCTCGFKKTIGIYGSISCVCYSYEIKRVIFTWTNHSRSSWESNWHGEIEDKHKEHWLRRFGGKRIKILICANSRRAGTTVGTSRHRQILTPKGCVSRSDDQVITVKTVPIELNFKEWGSIAS